MKCNLLSLTIWSRLNGFILLAACAVLASGCAAPRYVNAKTRLESSFPTNQVARDNLRTLVSEVGLIPSDQPRADALRVGAFEYFANLEKDLTIRPAGATTGNVQVDLLALSERNAASTFPNPTEFRFQLANVPVGRSGTPTGAVIARFGQSGSSNAVEFSSDSAGGFLSFELFDIYRDRSGRAASGKFSAILRNKNDRSDQRAILVMDGSFITGVKN